MFGGLKLRNITKQKSPDCDESRNRGLYLFQIFLVMTNYEFLSRDTILCIYF